MSKEENWDIIIKPKSGFFSLGLKELFNYRDLIMLFVKRDMVAQYKQTILGPFWLIIQPLVTTLVFTIIFGNFAKFSSGTIPYAIFTLSGLTIWNFFSSSLNKTSSVFIGNASIFGKVYFPRLTVPVSSLISNGFAFLIQFSILIILLSYYKIVNNFSWEVNLKLVALLPFLLILTGLFGMGAGLIISSVTTKYRDLSFLVSFALQFLMYFSSVVFPINNFSPKVQAIFNLNPLVHIVNLFRAIMVNVPFSSYGYLLYVFVFVVIVLLTGIVIFNKVEKSFMDTV